MSGPLGNIVSFRMADSTAGLGQRFIETGVSEEDLSALREALAEELKGDAALRTALKLCETAPEGEREGAVALVAELLASPARAAYLQRIIAQTGGTPDRVSPFASSEEARDTARRALAGSSAVPESATASGGMATGHWPELQRAMRRGRPPSREAMLWLRGRLATLEGGAPRSEAIDAARHLGLREGSSFSADNAWFALVKWMAVLDEEGTLPSSWHGEEAARLHEQHERGSGPNPTFEEFRRVLGNEASFEELLRGLGINKDQGPREFSIAGDGRRGRRTRLRLWHPPKGLPDETFSLRFRLVGGRYVLAKASGRGSPPLTLAFAEGRLGEKIGNAVERAIIMSLADVSVPYRKGEEELLTSAKLAAFISDPGSPSRLKSIFAAFGLDLPKRFALTGIRQTDGSIISITITTPEKADSLISHYFKLHFEVLPNGRMRLAAAKGTGGLDLAVAHVDKRLKRRWRTNPTVERAMVAVIVDTQPAGKADDSSLTGDKFAHALKARTGLQAMLAIYDALGRPIRGPFTLTGRLTSDGTVVTPTLTEGEVQEVADEDDAHESRFRLYFEPLPDGRFRLKGAGGTAWHRFATAFIEGQLRRRTLHPVEKAMITGFLRARSKAEQEAHSLTVRDMGAFIGRRGLYSRINSLHQILTGEPLPANFVLIGQRAPDGAGIYGFRVAAVGKEGHIPSTYFQLHFERSENGDANLKKVAGGGSLNLAVSYARNRSGISKVFAAERALIASLVAPVATPEAESEPLSMKDVEAFVRDRRALSRLGTIFAALGRALPADFTLSGKKAGTKESVSGLEVGVPDAEITNGFWLRFGQETGGGIKLTATGGTGGLDLAIAFIESRLGVKIGYPVERVIIAVLLGTRAVPPRGEEPSRSLTVGDIAAFAKDGQALARMGKVYEFLTGRPLPARWALSGTLKTTGVVHKPTIEAAADVAGVRHGIKLPFERKGGGSRLVLPREPNPSTKAVLAAMGSGD